MAFMNQAKKSKIAAALKAVMPADWKYSLRVVNYSTIVMTVRQAPVDVLAIAQARNNEAALRDGSTAYQIRGHFELNTYWFDAKEWGDAGSVIAAALQALNIDNHDRSDSYTDYFDVGHYVTLSFGSYDKPFMCTAPVLADA